MASTRETLEAALQAAWDRETLTVYADHLLAEGDPRGELIALDLQIDACGNSVELSKRRTSLLFAWLGGLVPADNVHASWVGDSMKYGFIDDLLFDGAEANAVGRLEQVLESPAGAYIRGLTMRGTAAEIEEAAMLLWDRTHAWLTRLTIGLSQLPSAMSDAAANALLRSMPQLARLELRSAPVFTPLSNATITHLAIRGADVYRALGEGSTFERVVDLDLDLSSHTRYGYEEPEYYDEEYAVEAPEPSDEDKLPVVKFPALRRLDLSKCGMANLDTAYQFLRTFDARAHVTHLVIPQLRNAADRQELVTAIRDMRALEVIEVVHGHYYEPAEIPNVRFVRPEPWPWPTQELASGRGVRIFMPHAKYGDEIPILDAVFVMEQRFEQMPAPVRAAWSQLWKHVAALEEPPAREVIGSLTREFPARVLADAVESCPELMQNGWRELREELSSRRPFAQDAMVRIERCRV